MTGPRIRCVGAVITDQADRLLMIKRGNPPGAGLWSLPGGRVEHGESDAQALIREVREETGLLVRPGRLAGQVEIPGPGGAVLDIHDYLADVVDGELCAGDDAAEARWVSAAELAALAATPALIDTLRGWGVLP